MRVACLFPAIWKAILGSIIGLIEIGGTQNNHYTNAAGDKDFCFKNRSGVLVKINKNMDPY